MINDFKQAVTIAGSDSDGSAGIQADLKTFFANHVYGASIVTSCVAGNSYGITDSVNLPTSFIHQEFADLDGDFQINAAKTGMLATTDIVKKVALDYQKYDFGPLVVDPVIMTKFGKMLIEDEAFNTIKIQLLPLAFVLTPNFFEAQKLTGLDGNDDDFMPNAADLLQQMGAKNVIIKGKHDNPQQSSVTDFVKLENGKHFSLTGPYFPTNHKNGTGDTLSAGITAQLALGKDVETAIRNAKKYVDTCIKNEIHVAHQYGPINHFAK